MPCAEVEVGTHLDQKQVRRELKKLKKQAAQAEEQDDDRKRGYNSFKGESDGKAPQVPCARARVCVHTGKHISFLFV